MKTKMEEIVYCIKDWDRHFENNRSRELRRADWIPLPNKMDSDGYTELISHRNGAAHFGCWIVLLQVASRCKSRGILTRDSSDPHTFSSLSRLTRIDSRILQAAVKRLIDIGWIETKTIDEISTLQTKGDIRILPQEGAAPLRRDCGEGAVSRARVGREGTEGKERKEERARCAPTSEQLSGTIPEALPPVVTVGDPSGTQVSLADSFDVFASVYVGPIEDGARSAFIRFANTPELIISILENTPLWMRTKTYSDGFHSACKFLASGVWKRAPSERLLRAGTENQKGRVQAARENAAVKFARYKGEM